MKKLRYIAYDFIMPTIERGSLIIKPEIEHGQIIACEKDFYKHLVTTIFVMERSTNDELAQYVSAGNLDIKTWNRTFGALGLWYGPELIRAGFTINVAPEYRNKGYGTVLMNAGAKYCRDTGISNIQGNLMIDENWERRARFYDRLNMSVKLSDEPTVKSYLGNPLLNTIAFTQNQTAEEILNFGNT